MQNICPQSQFFSHTVSILVSRELKKGLKVVSVVDSLSPKLFLVDFYKHKAYSWMVLYH